MSNLQDTEDTTPPTTSSVEPPDSVWSVIFELTGLVSVPKGFKKNVDVGSDWSRFIVKPKNYYTDIILSMPDSPEEKTYYDFATMCDTVILYWQEVDCTCTVHTVPRNALVLLQSVYLLRQMQSLSKVKLPSIAMFSGKHSN